MNILSLHTLRKQIQSYSFCFKVREKNSCYDDGKLKLVINLVTKENICFNIAVFNSL